MLGEAILFTLDQKTNPARYCQPFHISIMRNICTNAKKHVKITFPMNVKQPNLLSRNLTKVKPEPWQFGLKF